MSNPDKVILIVEDSDDDLFLMDIALKEVPCENPIQVARDGQEAVDYLNGAGQFADRRKFPFPALVFLDLKLPYLSGLEILAWMREQSDLPRMFVAVLTGSNQPADLKKANELGADTYLVKPATSQMLSDIFRQCNLS